MYGWRAGTRAGSHRDVCWIPAPGLPRGPGMPETGFAPPGDAAEGERSCWAPPRAGCSHLGGCSLCSFFPSPLQLPYPTMDLFFFLLAIYEWSEKKVWQKNGGSGMLIAQELAILGFRKCLVPGGPLNQQGNREGSTKDPVPCLDTKCT